MQSSTEPWKVAGRPVLQRPAIIFVGAFLACCFGTLALPLISDLPTILDIDSGQLGPFLALGAGVLIAALAGQQNAVVAGFASGVVTLVAIVFTLVTLVGVVLENILIDFVEIPWGGGAYAYGGAAACGVIATVLSGKAWYPGGPLRMSGIGALGILASAIVAAGMLIPDEGISFSVWMGFEIHALLGIASLTGTAAIGVALAAGFVTGAWGVGLHIGLVGYILIGWLASAPSSTTIVIAWSGVGEDYHGLTIAGFWAMVGLAVVNGVQILSPDTMPSSGQTA